MGRWEGSELIQIQQFNIVRLFIHPQFNSANLRNDVAILRLSQSVNLGVTPTITTACLPTSSLANINCTVAGYGSGAFGGVPQSTQKVITSYFDSQFT
jgi:Trypsin